MELGILKGKNILIVGASSGIGRATAELANNEGARTVLVARNETRLAEVCSRLKNDSNYHVFDVSETDSIDQFMKELVKLYGKFDGMMYSAGDVIRAPLSVCKPATVKKSMQVNYFSFVEFLRCFSKKKVCNNNASIVVMSSASSLKGEKGQLTLSCSKAAVNMAVRCSARELAERNIRVNAIAAAYVEGSIMVEKTMEIYGESQVESTLNENQPLGIGKPEDIANLAVFLLSEQARYITGAVISADGGYTA